MQSMGDVKRIQRSCLQPYSEAIEQFMIPVANGSPFERFAKPYARSNRGLQPYPVFRIGLARLEHKSAAAFQLRQLAE